MLHRRIRIGCTFTYVAEIDTPVIFQVKPCAAADVAIDHERWASEPHMLIRGYEDLYQRTSTPPDGASAATSLTWRSRSARR